MHQQQDPHSNENRRTQDGSPLSHCIRQGGNSNLVWFIAAGLITVACSSNNSGGTGPSIVATGGAAAGATGIGGSSTATGGTSATTTTGTSSIGGQTGAQGGSSAAGGTSNGGSTSSVGGSATGGTTTSATATGGAATGGASTSSTAATGGDATGGKSSTNTGGATTGGSATGGTATGGATTATGGTAVGGTATGGSTSSCAAASITKVSDSDYQLKVCNVTMDVNPQIGARITKLTMSSTNIIQPNTATSYDGGGDSNKSGITFWTSPQSGWTPTWPPVAAIDGNAYTVTDTGATSGHLVLTSEADTTLGASVIKDISADSATGWITVKYTITVTKAIQVAAWQIARVPRKGVIFFPCSTAAIKTPSNTWTLTQTGGYDWIDDKNQSTSSNTDGTKYVNDGGPVTGQSYTILAYALGGNLFLMKYPDVAKASFASGEGDTEVYPGSGYIELEAQGDSKSLAANGTLNWTIQMRVDPMPGSVTVASGNASLISFAEQQAAL